MKENLLVYIIILNWKNYGHTINCVKRCQKQNYPNFKILVIENNSPNQSENKLRQSLPEIEILQTGKNLGYAGGNNVGINYALNSKAEFIWILNPDVEVEADSLSNLISFLQENPVVGVCGPRVFQGSKPYSFTFDGLSLDSSDGYQSSFNLSASTTEIEEASALDVDCVSGCSMLVRSSVFLSTGLLREDFFHYYEDAEFCCRARANGWRTSVFKPAKVVHARHKKKIINAVGFYNERSRIIFSRIKDSERPPKLITRHNQLLIIYHLKYLNIVFAFAFLFIIFIAALSGSKKIIRSIHLPS